MKLKQIESPNIKCPRCKVYMSHKIEQRSCEKNDKDAKVQLDFIPFYTIGNNVEHERRILYYKNIKIYICPKCFAKYVEDLK